MILLGTSQILQKCLKQLILFKVKVTLWRVKMMTKTVSLLHYFFFSTLNILTWKNQLRKSFYISSCENGTDINQMFEDWISYGKVLLTLTHELL